MVGKYDSNSYLRSSSTESAQLFMVGIVVGSDRMSVMLAGIHFAFFDFLPVKCTSNQISLGMDTGCVSQEVADEMMTHSL